MITRLQPDIVVFGHSHVSCVEVHDGRLYINPGSAGPARFKLPRSVAKLHLPQGGPQSGTLPEVEMLTLPGKAPKRQHLAQAAEKPCTASHHKHHRQGLQDALHHSAAGQHDSNVEENATQPDVSLPTAAQSSRKPKSRKRCKHC
eukprot:jgi/Chrzof1/8357/Cz03g07130.t1